MGGKSLVPTGGEEKASWSWRVDADGQTDNALSARESKEPHPMVLLLCVHCFVKCVMRGF